jgi:hypothetical protein
VLLAGAGLWLAWPSDSWGQVAHAVQAKPWIHGLAREPGGETSEFWFAPGRELVASRERHQALFYDQRLRIVSSYDPEEKVLYRVPDAFGSHQEEFRSLQKTFQALFRADVSLNSPDPHTRIVAQQRRRVVDGERTWTEYDLTLRLGNDADGRQARVVFRVDSTSHLPHTLTFIPGPPHPEVTYQFDYPDKGPADVYDLGVPRTAKVVDRVPTDDLERVLAGLRAGRDRLGPYHAAVAKVSVTKTESIIHLEQVWRQSRRWRVESGILARTARAAAERRSAFPDDLEKWWRSRLEDKDWWFLAQVCNGQAVYLPDYAPKGAGGQQPLEFRLAERLSADGDPLHYAQAYMSTFPEFWAYPDMPVPSEQFEAALDADPAKGPPGTIALTIRMSRAFARHQLPEAYRWLRYWLDPEKTYVVRRAEWSLRFPEDAGAGNADPVDVPGFINFSLEGDLYARSPNGVWYPTLVRTQLRGQDGKFTQEDYQFHLDFPAELPDGLFKPVNRSEK